MEPTVIVTTLKMLLGKQPNYALDVDDNDTATPILREILRNEKLYFALVNADPNSRLIPALLAKDIAQAYIRLFQDDSCDRDDYLFPEPTTQKERAFIWAEKAGFEVDSESIRAVLKLETELGPDGEEDEDDIRDILERLARELEKFHTFLLTDKTIA